MQPDVFSSFLGEKTTIGRNGSVNHKVLLLNAGFSLYGLIQQNPTLKQQFALLGLNFGNEVMVNDRQQLIGQISQSVKNCRLLLLVDNAPELRAGRFWRRASISPCIRMKRPYRISGNI